MNRGVVVVLAIAIAAGTGVFVQRQMADSTADPVPVPAAAPAAAPVAEADPAATAAAEPVIPDTLPHFELTDREGKKRSLGDWKGQPLLVNYWATWCAPCRREIPLLNEVRAEGKAQKVEVIGIAVDFRDDVLAYAKETTISYPLLIGEEDGLEAVKAVGMQPMFPFTVFADSQQRIVALKVGELHRDEAEMILARIAAVDAGKLELAKAREEITAELKALAVKRATTEAAAEAPKPG